MVDLIPTRSGATVALGAPFLAAVFGSDPAQRIFDFFSEYLAPHPEGFSGYFEPSSDGWHESRIDHCAVRVLRLEDGQHLLLVAWQTDEPADVTQRQMRQMLDAWTRLFPGATPMPRDRLVELLGSATALNPTELELAVENAGATRRGSDVPAPEPKKRRRFFGP